MYDVDLLDVEIELLVDLAENFVNTYLLHNREGSHGGRNRFGERGSFPLSDAAQSRRWRCARDLLVKIGRPVPVSGEIDDA
jgi:hypothetical protein